MTGIRPVLALDLATATGWALRDQSSTITGGVQTFPLRRGESPGMRWLRFRRWLREVLELGEMKGRGVVACELPLAGGRGARMGIGRELSTIVEEEAAAQGIETTGIYPSSLKKWATGKGNAPKGAMLEAARRRYPDLDITDDNHADALLVLAWALEEIGEEL